MLITFKGVRLGVLGVGSWNNQGSVIGVAGGWTTTDTDTMSADG